MRQLFQTDPRTGQPISPAYGLIQLQNIDGMPYQDHAVPLWDEMPMILVIAFNDGDRFFLRVKDPVMILIPGKETPKYAYRECTGYRSDHFCDPKDRRAAELGPLNAAPDGELLGMKNPARSKAG